MDKRPIGIFDSGIGGLTVLKEIAQAMPLEDTLYLGDTARVPYGTKSAETVRRYSLENARFLLSHDIKLLVVACNTASAYAADELEKTLGVPVVGVLRPGARMAVESTRGKRVGVTGTEGTIRSNAYFDAIKEYDSKVVVFSRACPLFVSLAEEGWTDNAVAELTAETYLAGLKDEDIDVLLLGCTHYPLLKKTIQKVMGRGVKLVDSAFATAAEVHRVLLDRGLVNDDNHVPRRRFFVTDSPDRFEKLGRAFFGADLVRAEVAVVGA